MHIFSWSSKLYQTAKRRSSSRRRGRRREKQEKKKKATFITLGQMILQK
jgi:hypothetical protein